MKNLFTFRTYKLIWHFMCHINSDYSAGEAISLIIRLPRRYAPRNDILRMLFIVTSLSILFSFVIAPVSAFEKEAGNAAQLALNFSPPDQRTERLERYLRSHNSPLSGEAGAFVAAADEYDLDWRLVAAIAGVESTFGKRVPYQSYNAWGWGIFTGEADGVHFASWEDGIRGVSAGLRHNYLNKGATSLQQVGRRYAASATWYTRVNFFMNKIEEFDKVTSEDLDLVS